MVRGLGMVSAAPLVNPSRAPTGVPGPPPKPPYASPVVDQTIRVLVVDDHEVLRRGVEAVLSRAGGFEVCGEAATADEAVRLAGRLQPDVVLMDVRLDGSSGIAATREMRGTRPDTRVLVFTGHGDDESLFSAIAAGASGFVRKQAPAHELVHALREVAAGRSLLDTTVTTSVLDRLRQSPQHPLDERIARLSHRELDVVRLVAEGMGNGEIAAHLHLSEKTVKNHLTRVFTKLEVSRRAEAAAYYLRHQPPD
jgi:two-component system, NarL family, response regulator DevR